MLSTTHMHAAAPQDPASIRESYTAYLATASIDIDTVAESKPDRRLVTQCRAVHANTFAALYAVFPHMKVELTVLINDFPKRWVYNTKPSDVPSYSSWAKNAFLSLSRWNPAIGLAAHLAIQKAKEKKLVPPPIATVLTFATHAQMSISAYEQLRKLQAIRTIAQAQHAQAQRLQAQRRK